MVRANFVYKNHTETRMELGVWDFAKEEWLEEKVVKHNCLCAIIHPGLEIAVGQVPIQSEIEEANKSGAGWTVESFIEKMQAGIPFDDGDPLRFDVATNSRNDGKAMYTRGVNLGEIYFGVNNPTAYSVYGSILFTECKKTISANIKTLIVDDEDPEIRAAGFGDSHGKAKRKIIEALTAGVPRMREDGESNTPLQIRAGFKNAFLFKGTIATPEENKWPKIIKQRYGRDDWDLIIPISGIKGNKPEPGTSFIDFTVYLGLVHFAENREAVASQLFFAWFTPKAIKYAVLIELAKRCEELNDAVKDIDRIPEIFSSVEEIRADIGYTGQIDPESWEADDDGFSAVNDSELMDGADSEYVDPIIEIIARDKFGVLLNHPYMVRKIIDRLGRRWLRFALNTHIKMRSGMMMPDDSIPFGKIVCGWLEEGWHIAFRNPILDHESILMVYNIRGSYPHLEAQKGTIWMSHETGSRSQGDYDGDFMTLVPLTAEQSAFAAELIENIENGWGDIEFTNYITNQENQYPDEPFRHIIFEVVYSEYLWGTSGNVIKPKKIKRSGTPEEVFYDVIGDITGIVSNLLQWAKANGTFNNLVDIPNHDLNTDEYIGGTTQMSIISFLKQQMQIAVDSIKAPFKQNMQGLDICRAVIEKGGKPAWIHKSAYKDSLAYRTHTIPIGTLSMIEGKDGKKFWKQTSQMPNPDDVISLTISLVNAWWTEFKGEKRHVSEFRTFFPDSYDNLMKNYADEIHKWYGTAMKQANSVGKLNPGTVNEKDPEPWRYVDERKKNMRVVRKDADLIRENLDNVETILEEEVEERGDSKFLFKLWELSDKNLANEIYDGVIDDKRLSGVYQGEGQYQIATSFEWVSAFWHAAHSPNAGEKSEGASVFKLYLDEILKRLENPTDMNKTKWFAGDDYPLGDYLFGSHNAVRDNSQAKTSFPPRAIPQEGSNTIWMPSRVNNKGRLIDPKSPEGEGIKVPNELEAKVERRGHLYGRKTNPKHIIYVRSNSNMPWRELGVIGLGSTVPPLNTPLKVALETFKLTQKPEPMMMPENQGIVGYRGDQGIITFRKADKAKPSVMVTASRSRSGTDVLSLNQNTLPETDLKRFHDELDKHIEKELQFNIGDAPGVDKLGQAYLLEKNYELVTIWYIGNQPRNQLNPNWNANRIDGSFEDRDVAMLKASDILLAIWDGISSGTKRNIESYESRVKRNEQSTVIIRKTTPATPTTQVSDNVPKNRVSLGGLVKVVGHVDPSSGIWEHINQLSWKSEDNFRSTVDRETVAINLEIVYSATGNYIVKGVKDGRIANFLNIVMPMWGTALALRYAPGGNIKKHRDTSGFGRTVVCVSSVDYILVVGDTEYQIPANTVIAFPSKQPHAAWHEGNVTRLALCAWEIDWSKLEGINIWSGSTEPIGGALTNATELSFSKGSINKHYPVVDKNGKEWPDADSACQNFKTGNFDNDAEIMQRIIVAKLKQYPELVREIDAMGGSNWLSICSHNTTAKGKWEGKGLESRFIRVLMAAYEQVKSGEKASEFYEVYSDGAASGNPGKGGYGVVIVNDGKSTEKSGGFALTTNNRMELMAAIIGIESTPNNSEVVVTSDSKYVVDSINSKWVEKWRDNDWKNSKGTVKNIDLWERMLVAISIRQVSFKWVKGHAGHVENERAGQLAVEASQKSNLPADEGYQG